MRYQDGSVGLFSTHSTQTQIHQPQAPRQHRTKRRKLASHAPFSCYIITSHNNSTHPLTLSVRSNQEPVNQRSRRVNTHIMKPPPKPQFPFQHPRQRCMGVVVVRNPTRPVLSPRRYQHVLCIRRHRSAESSLTVDVQIGGRESTGTGRGRAERCDREGWLARQEGAVEVGLWKGRLPWKMGRGMWCL